MLLWLFEKLSEFSTGFNVFGYITLRSILSALTALLLSLLLGPAFIRRLVRNQVGQPVRELGPQSHFSKAGTPTMGGALIDPDSLVGKADEVFANVASCSGSTLWESISLEK